MSLYRVGIYYIPIPSYRLLLNSQAVVCKVEMYVLNFKL